MKLGDGIEFKSSSVKSGEEIETEDQIQDTFFIYKCIMVAGDVRSFFPKYNANNHREKLNVSIKS